MEKNNKIKTLEELFPKLFHTSIKVSYSYDLEAIAKDQYITRCNIYPPEIKETDLFVTFDKVSSEMSAYTKNLFNMKKDKIYSEVSSEKITGPFGKTITDNYREYYVKNIYDIKKFDDIYTACYILYNYSLYDNFVEMINDRDHTHIHYIDENVNKKRKIEPRKIIIDKSIFPTSRDNLEPINVPKGLKKSNEHVVFNHTERTLIIKDTKHRYELYWDGKTLECSPGIVTLLLFINENEKEKYLFEINNNEFDIKQFIGCRIYVNYELSGTLH